MGKNSSYVKKSHYVPRCHLKHFSDKNGLYIYDKDLKKIYINSVNNTLCEGKLYDIQPDIITRYLGEQIKEKWFAYEESKLAISITRIINNSYNIEDIKNILRYIPLQYTRVPCMINTLINYGKEVKASIEHSTWVYDSKIMLNKDVRNNFAASLSNGEIFIIRSEKTKFILSDNGVSVLNRKDIISGTEFYYPLSPEVCMLIKTHGIENQYIFNDNIICEDISEKDLDKHEIDNINCWIWTNAFRFVISRSERDLIAVMNLIINEACKYISEVTS